MHFSRRFLQWKKKIQRKWQLCGTKSDISTQPNVYDTETKTLMCQGVCVGVKVDYLKKDLGL